VFVVAIPAGKSIEDSVGVALEFVLAVTVVENDAPGETFAEFGVAVMDK